MINGKYTTREVALRTYTTLRQLQYWDEEGFVKPIQVKHRRLYTKKQLDLITEANILRDYGARSMQAAFELVRIRRTFKWKFASLRLWVCRLQGYLK